MASDRSFVGFVAEQASGAGPVSTRAMFGEYALYAGAKPSFLVEEVLEDRDAFSRLVAATAAEVPEPKPKKRKVAPHRHPFSGSGEDS